MNRNNSILLIQLVLGILAFLLVYPLYISLSMGDLDAAFGVAIIIGVLAFAINFIKNFKT